MSKWLSIIGIGEDGWDGLGAAARQAVQQAEVIIGSARTLAMLPAGTARHMEWPQPFAAVLDQLRPLRGQRVVMLATGDPMNFGAARKILTDVPVADVTIIPHISAFSLAAARMGWSLPDCDCLTLHGRPAANLEAFMQPDVRLLALTEDGSTIAEACRRLVARGFGNSAVTVLENLGGAQERISHGVAEAMPAQEWSALNTLAIHCRAGADAKIWPRGPGLPDGAFQHDGKITKREVRAATLAALGPVPDQVLWDVGAGSGAVAIEWMRAARGCEAYAIEPLADRRAMIAHNADALGTPRLHVVAGEAPAAYAGLPQPHAVFIGGGISVPGTFEQAWAALRPGGRMVANVVTLEGEMHLYDLQEKHGGELVRMETSTLTRVGSLRAMRPRMAVTQWRAVKP